MTCKLAFPKWLRVQSFIFSINCFYSLVPEEIASGVSLSLPDHKQRERTLMAFSCASQDLCWLHLNYVLGIYIVSAFKGSSELLGFHQRTALVRIEILT